MSIPQHPAITAWYQSELAASHLSGNEDCKVVISLALWGETYVQRFLDYELPSITAPRNHAALEDAKAEVVIYADGRALDMLRTRKLSSWPDIMIWTRQIPDDVMQVVYQLPQYKYTLMAAVHNLGIAQAARKGAGFSMGVADIVYSENYFGRLLELGKTHQMIAHHAFITSQERAKPELNALRTAEGIIHISAPFLGDIGWRHAAGLMKSWNMNEIETFEEVPGTHFMLWRGYDSVRMHCPHITPVWIGPKRCKAARLEPGDTLDALPLGDYYVPTPEDDMVIVTLDDTREPPAGLVPFERFRTGLIPFASCMPQFKVPVVLPTLSAEDGYLPDGVIEQRFQKLCALLGV
jgi:hypothetical protein